MMTDDELKEIGMTRKEWDKLVKLETEYTNEWAKQVDISKL